MNATPAATAVLPAAHVPLNQAGHGRAALHIPDTVCHGAPLGSGRGKREQRPESRRRIPLDPGPGPAPGTALEPQKAKLEQEQLLEHQAAPRNRKRPMIGRKMDVVERIPAGAELMRLPQGKGKGIIVQLIAQRQEGIGHHGFDHPGGQALGLRVDRADPGSPLGRLDEGRCHFRPPEPAGHRAEEEIVLPFLDLGSCIFIVEQGDMEQAHSVRGGEPVQGQAPAHPMLLWRRHGGGADAARLAHRCGGDGDNGGPVFVLPGIMP